MIDPGSVDPLFCSYEQKSRWIALIFELIMPSIGLFYLGRIIHAFIKMILFCCGVFHQETKTCPIGACCFSILYFVDLIFIALGVYTDGNGIPIK